MRRSVGAGALGLFVLLVTVVALADAPKPQMQMPPNMPAMDRYQFGLLRQGKAWTPKRTAATDSRRGAFARCIRSTATQENAP